LAVGKRDDNEVTLEISLQTLWPVAVYEKAALEWSERGIYFFEIRDDIRADRNIPKICDCERGHGDFLSLIVAMIIGQLGVRVDYERGN
jgi:hypothetical protein